MRFVKSTLCESASCVEVAGFFKSSLSTPTGNCVETDFSTGDVVLVRDSKDPDGPVLEFTHDEWTAFIGGVKLGEFDLPAKVDTTNDHLVGVMNDKVTMIMPPTNRMDVDEALRLAAWLVMCSVGADPKAEDRFATILEAVKNT